VVRVVKAMEVLCDRMFVEELLGRKDGRIPHSFKSQL
jgi:hypothetical protein